MRHYIYCAFCLAFMIPGDQQAVTMFNMSTLLDQKDSRWLQLEVCRENQRQKCSRSDADCKFAHPPTNVEVQNGRVTACYDSIKVGQTKFPRSAQFRRPNSTLQKI